MIKLVVFDLDGTLVDTSSAIEKLRKENLTREILSDEGIDVNEKTLHNAIKSTEKRVNNYKGPKRFKPGFFQIILADELGYDLSEEKAVKMENKFYEEMLENLELIPETREILKYLKERGVEVFLLSNSPESIMRRKVEKFGLENYFDKVFSSEITGTVKSEKKPFERILKKTVFSPEEILVVGNDTSEDSIAKEFGMETAILLEYLHTNIEDEQFEPDYELESFSDIKEIIER